MNTKKTATPRPLGIPLDPKQVPRRQHNAAAGLIEDTLAHHGLTQAAVARAMNISPGLICDIIKGRKGVSTDFALRFEKCLGISAQWLLRVQGFHDYCTAYHAKGKQISGEVQRLAS